MLNLTLNEDQLTDLVSNNPDLALEYFRDSSSTSGTNVTESSSFPKRLRFYMEKCGVTRAAMLTFFRGNYPSLLSSESGIGHILTGIRTPKLSVVLGMAECLEIAPAKLLPGVAGTYMVKQDDHVELYMDPDTTQSEESEEVIELPEVTETVLIPPETELFDEPELEPVSEDIAEEEDLLEVVPQSATIAAEPVSDDTDDDEVVDPEIAGEEDSVTEDLLEVEDDDEDIVDPAAEDEAKKDSEEEELEYLDDLLDNIF